MSAQSCPTLCKPLDCCPPGSSLHPPGKTTGVGCLFSYRVSSWPRDQSQAFCIGRWILYHWATWEAPISRDITLQKWRRELFKFYMLIMHSFLYVKNKSENTGKLLEIMNISLVDCGDVFTAVSICPNSPYCVLKMCNILYVSYISVKLL